MRPTSWGLIARLEARQMIPRKTNRSFNRHQTAMTQSPTTRPAVLPPEKMISQFARTMNVRKRETPGPSSSPRRHIRSAASKKLPTTKNSQIACAHANGNKVRGATKRDVVGRLTYRLTDCLRSTDSEEI